MFKDLVKLHLWLEQALREALACRPGHKNNMKTSLSAALFSLPETTNSGEKKGVEEGKSECSPGAPFTSCADEKIGEKRPTWLLRLSRDFLSFLLVISDVTHGYKLQGLGGLSANFGRFKESGLHEQVCQPSYSNSQCAHPC